MRNQIRIIITSLLFLSIPTLTIADTETSKTTVTNTTQSSQENEANNNVGLTTKTTVTKSTTTTSVVNKDAQIIDKIYARFAKDSALIGTDLTVTCVNGAVNISGNVTMTSQAEAAVSDAKAIEGVKDVISSINVITNQTNSHQPKTPNY